MISNDSSFIPVAKPWLDESEALAAQRVILSGWVTQGSEVNKFENEFAAYVGASYACAVSSCTTALHLALLAVGVKKGDEVITVSQSYIATANSIRHCAAIPVFVDVCPITHNIDVDKIKSVINSKTRAILCVHQVGMPCDLRAIIPLAKSYGLPVIEDAACAIGSEILWDGEWDKIGKPHGDIACFSFHPRKVVTTGDGGMITTNNSEWDKQFRLWRQHGMSIPDSVRHHSTEVVFESYPVMGYNYRMTDIQAAIGREQLKKLPVMLEKRRHLADRYSKQLIHINNIRLPHQPTWARSNWQSYSITLSSNKLQRAVMQMLRDQNIATRRGVMCAHREKALDLDGRHEWRCEGFYVGCKCEPGNCEKLRNSEYLQDHQIILPLYHQMTELVQDVVTQSLDACVSSSHGNMITTSP